jgi:histidine triad (HIT) family protein
MSTIFSKIINKEIPCHKIAEDANHLAFLDINPLVEGHVLVIPKREEDYLFDLSDSEISELMVFTKKIAQGIKLAITCKKVGVSVVGLEVAHAHVHLIPINSVSDMNFAKEKQTPTDAQLAQTAESIRKYLPAVEL